MSNLINWQIDPLTFGIWGLTASIRFSQSENVLSKGTFMTLLFLFHFGNFDLQRLSRIKEKLIQAAFGFKNANNTIKNSTKIYIGGVISALTILNIYTFSFNVFPFPNLCEGYTLLWQIEQRQQNIIIKEVSKGVSLFPP